ncbi:hypothetical protein VTN77DRAFT_5356 [Rasamsonia byssochlamydoides]|uniref:uncharacterized protein n=1 Tax=Rasamsonia byssochlamydoides TaxID=89139 RepID=UPI0037446645
MAVGSTRIANQEYGYSILRTPPERRSEPLRILDCRSMRSSHTGLRDYLLGTALAWWLWGLAGPVISEANEAAVNAVLRIRRPQLFPATV